MFCRLVNAHTLYRNSGRLILFKIVNIIKLYININMICDSIEATMLLEEMLNENCTNDFINAFL